MCLCLVLMVGMAIPVCGAVAESAGGGSGEMDRMVPVDPMPITIIQQGKVKGILMVEFYIEATSIADAGRISQFMPRLADAYRTGLHEFAAHEIRLDRPVNLDRLDLYLTRETRSVLGQKNIHVIFKQIMVQKK